MREREEEMGMAGGRWELRAERRKELGERKGGMKTEDREGRTIRADKGVSLKIPRLSLTRK